MGQESLNLKCVLATPWAQLACRSTDCTFAKKWEQKAVETRRQQLARSERASRTVGRFLGYLCRTWRPNRETGHRTGIHDLGILWYNYYHIVWPNMCVIETNS